MTILQNAAVRESDIPLGLIYNKYVDEIREYEYNTEGWP